MRARALCRLLFAAGLTATCLGCPDSVELPDAGAPDAEPQPDALVPDTGADEMDAGVADAEPADADPVDAEAPDAAQMDAGAPPDSGPRVVPIVVAYSATVEARLLADLYLTETSTTRVKVTPTLAGGPNIGGKGEEVVSGVLRFEWTADRNLVYTAQQDTFDFYEIYLADDPGSQRFTKLSQQGGGGPATDWSLSPDTSWLTFAQVPMGTSRGSHRFAVRARAGATPVQISMGSAGVPYWSPNSTEIAFQDIIGSRDDRDLWHVDLASARPVRTRAHPGANIGFGGRASWSPDGARLAFSADETASRVFELWQVVVTAGTPAAAVRVTAAFPAGADVAFGDATIQYAPAGGALAYVADPDTDNLEELYVLDPTGRLPVTPTKLNLAFGPNADGVDRFVWSADGARIVYAGDHVTDGLHELYLTSAAAPTGVRLHPALGAGESVAHEQFIRGDDMVLFTRYDGATRRLLAVDVSGAAPGAPVDLGPIDTFSSRPRYEVSPSGDYVVFPDRNDPPQVHIARLTGTPTVTASLDTFLAEFDIARSWCWGPNDELLVIGGDGQLYLVEDLDTGDRFLVSGPLADGGRVTACAFPPEAAN